MLLLIIPIAGGDENDTSENDNANMILLKAGPIHTDIVSVAGEKEIEEAPAASIASYSVDTTETDDNLGSYYIVQFDGPVLEEWKNELAVTGAALFYYVPNNAFVVRMDPAQKEQVDSLDFVKWTGEYRAPYKHQVNTGKVATLSMSPSSYDAADLIVLLFDESESRNILEKIISMDADIVESSPRILRVRITRDRINDLAAIEGICWIEEYAVPVVFNDVAAGIINVNHVHENYRLNGTGQIVAVCDTGLDTGVDDEFIHEDIRGRIRGIFDLVGDGAGDQHGHGTHVTGSVLGNGANSGGQYKGMAHEALLVFQAAGTAGGELTGIPADLNLLFQQAYNQGARIHTNSWGYTHDSGNYSLNSWQVDTFMWNNPDMLILFAAGNYGEDIDKNGIVDSNSITPPGTSKNCITVGSSENNRSSLSSTTWGSNYGFPINNDIRANNIEGMAAFSSRGPTDDVRIKPDIVAPGTYIASTKSSLATALYSMPGYPEYAYSSGTSMATPLVAGAAALARQYYTEIEDLPSPSAALIKATLINGAHDMTPGQYGTGNYQEIVGRPDHSQGWGRVDVENSLFPEYPKVTAYHDMSEGLVTSQAWSADYGYIKDGEPLRATLVWTDYPGSPASGKALVNDLDLTVTGSGNTYYGNGASESINNIEAVEIESTSSGSYQFTVTGENIPQGPQPFALVLSFTCDNNLFPAHDSYTSESMAIIATDVVHPGGVNLSSINMKINGASVSYTNSAINDGYRIQHDTSAPYQSGEYNVSVTAFTAKGQPFSYRWKFNVNAAPVTVTGITVKAAPTKITYIEGEELNVQGLIITLLKSDSSTEDVIFTNFSSKGITVNPANGTVLATTNTLVTITHTESGKSTTQAITVNALPVTVTEIKVETAPTKVTYTEGEKLDVQGMVITLLKSDSSTEEVAFANFSSKGITVNPANGTVLATTSTLINISHTESGKSTTQAITVNAVTVTGVSVKSTPAKVIYTEGDNLNLQGMVITLTRSNSATEDVIFTDFSSKGIIVIPVNGTVLATTNTLVTITHTESGKSTTQLITVNTAPIKVTSITINGAGNAMAVEKGKTLQMYATVSPANAANKDISWSVINGAGTATISQTGLLTATGVGTVTVRATATDGSGILGTLNVMVTEVPVVVTNISVKTAPTKLTYTEDETLNLQGLVITLTKSNSSTEEVAFANFSSKGIVVTPANGTVLATINKLVTITHTESGKSTTQVITVNAVPVTVTGIVVKTAPTKVTYTEGETLNLQGMVITLLKSNSSTEDVAFANFNSKGIVVAPASGTVLTTSNTTVTITHSESEKNTTQVITVNAVPVTVTGITVKAAPTKLVYTEGEALNLHDIIITLTRSNSVTEDVIFTDFSSKGIVVTPANGTVLATTNTMVAIAHTESGKSTTQAITVNAVQSPPPATSGGGGGGGGGSTGEKTENILLKDVSSVFVGKDAVRFDFKNPGSDIQYIEYTSLKNSGTITATIEMLKDRSIFAVSSPEGTVYRHVNIWLGKSGYATEANIIDPGIVFRVDNSWISSNNIDPASIILNRYSDGTWSKLPTEQTGSDADFLYFRAATPGFSPFAITGESFENESILHSTSEALFSTDSPENRVGALDDSSDPKANGAQAEKTLPAISVTVTLIIVIFACFLLRKQ
ncbi:PGF-pre-PGF domain-containing protein [Methanolobus sp.]|uniref:PGF-pre-PGF domain-containing protein n=1 Tax=Methanolobus sp. TaxID=1874737 RepID=UPI0025D88953|nr:PGF-pre-PGF domain-containing protein [Methanolobus sp.]